MALYAAQSDLLNRVTKQELMQLTDDSRPPQQVNTAIVTAALTTASAIVDSYCRSRYAIPLQPSADAVAVTADLALFEIYSRRPATRMPDNVATKRNNAIAFLKDIAAGKASLDQQTASPQSYADGGKLPSRNDERFTDRNLEGFV